MQNVQINGDFFSLKDISEFEQSLNGVRYEKSALISAFESVCEYVSGADGKEIVNAMFE